MYAERKYFAIKSPCRQIYQGLSLGSSSDGVFLGAAGDHVFSVPVRSLLMFSWCANITSAPMAMAKTADVGCPKRTRRMGSNVTSTNDPAETKPVRQIMTRHVTPARSKAKGCMARKTPTVVATPLPPRKRSRKENMCPRMAPSPSAPAARAVSPHRGQHPRR